MKIFQFMIFHIILQRAQNHCVLGSVKEMDFLWFLMAN